MSTPRTCPRCGALVDANASAQGICARCMLSVALEDLRAESTSERGLAPRVLPDTREIEALLPALEIHELLGIGGMGSVWRARHRGLERWMALKLLHPRAAADPTFAERFAREARALASLSHPNIVAVHDVGESNGCFYLTMELVEGRTLRELLRSGPIEEARAIQIVLQLCAALSYAHEHGVVHRDIKPENVLVDKHGRVKIADFGLAKLRSRDLAWLTLTGDQETMGTPHYMAPEQVERPRDVDARADLFSLGVVFYELLTGELPLGRFEDPSKRAEIDPRLDAIVVRALEKNPRTRYQSAHELRKRLEALAVATARAKSAQSKLKRLKLDDHSPRRVVSALRGVLVLTPVAALLFQMGAALPLPHFVLALLSVTLFAWCESIALRHNRQSPRSQWWTFVALALLLGAAVAFSAALAQILYAENASLDALSKGAFAVRWIAIVLLVHLFWTCRQSWPSFRNSLREERRA